MQGIEDGGWDWGWGDGIRSSSGADNHYCQGSLTNTIEWERKL